MDEVTPSKIEIFLFLFFSLVYRSVVYTFISESGFGCYSVPKFVLMFYLMFSLLSTVPVGMEDSASSIIRTD